ncbi:MAG: Pyrophosphatase PpaX [Alphaproteobacteria bacterium ADurb.Bin438]|nr:MAG: Pyrophosphatase PpaX [Alphaproteobacteria bacterium ADurb.Bin438]
MIKNIFFDFDGTLVNSQLRLYNLFKELTNCSMTYDEYWKIKRQRINQKDFLKRYFNYSDEMIADFKKNWLLKIEEPHRFKDDFLVDGMREVLEKLSKDNNLYLVTHRQSQELTLKEAEDLGISKYFKKIMASEQKITKVQMIENNVKVSKEDILIGDTGEDIKDAKKLGIKSIAVAWGILNYEVLKEYNPDFIAKGIEDFDKCPFL